MIYLVFWNDLFTQTVVKHRFNYLFIKFLSVPFCFIISKPHFGVVLDYSEIEFIINCKPLIHYIGYMVINKTTLFYQLHLKNNIAIFILIYWHLFVYKLFIYIITHSLGNTSMNKNLSCNNKTTNLMWALSYISIYKLKWLNTHIFIHFIKITTVYSRMAYNILQLSVASCRRNCLQQLSDSWKFLLYGP